MRAPLTTRCGRVGLVAGGVAFALFLLAGHAPRVVESVYARGIFPRVVALPAALGRLVPFSLTEWIFGAIVLLLLLGPWAGFRRARRDGAGIARALAAGLLTTLGRAGLVWAVFLLLWGFNYGRPRPRELFGLAAGQPAKERAEAIVAAVGARADALRAKVAEDKAGVVVTPDDWRALDAHIAALQAGVLGVSGLPAPATGRAKTFLASPLLLRWGVSGVYGPFSGEPNLVLPSPPGRLPFVIAHERAHLAGFAWEEDASFVALLTVWRSDRPDVRYSGWLELLTELRRAPKGRHPGILRDLAAMSRFLHDHQGFEAPAVNKAYSGYLSAHGVKGGSRSYGRVAGMALAWLDAHGMPDDPLQTGGPIPAGGGPKP